MLQRDENFWRHCWRLLVYLFVSILRYNFQSTISSFSASFCIFQTISPHLVILIPTKKKTFSVQKPPQLNPSSLQDQKLFTPRFLLQFVSVEVTALNEIFMWKKIRQESSFFVVHKQANFYSGITMLTPRKFQTEYLITILKFKFCCTKPNNLETSVNIEMSTEKINKKKCFLVLESFFWSKEKKCDNMSITNAYLFWWPHWSFRHGRTGCTTSTEQLTKWHERTRIHC